MMNTDEFIKNTMEYSVEGLNLYRDMIKPLVPFYRENSSVSKFNQMVLVPLFTSLYSTGESILVLTSQGDAWDADILMRSLLEGSIKFIYLIQDNLKEDSELIKEYAFAIPEMQKITEHRKAVDAIKVFNKYGIKKHPFETSILSEEKLILLEEKYPRKLRMKMEQRWGFSVLLKTLIEKNKKYEDLLSIYYSYALSSHLVHYDGACINMRQAALNNFGINDNGDLELAHITRIISNVLSLGLIRTSEYIFHYNIELESIEQNVEAVMKFLEKLDQYSNSIIEDKY